MADNLPPLPRAAVDEHNLQGGRLLYTAGQMRAYALAAQALEREACAKVCVQESFVMATRDMTRGALHCAGAIRARGNSHD